MFDHSEEKPALAVDVTTRAHMLEMGRWGKFLAILMFIVMGLMVLAGAVLALSMSSLADAFGGGGSKIAGPAIFLLYIVFASLYFYPTYALYKYTSLIKYALANEDQFTFNDAFRYLKNSFRYIGILMLIIICIYALLFLVGGLASVLFGAFA